ncbi:MAG: Kinase binding protein CGI-121 [Candidatus Argoarchaeum ethanivorans]|uniref:Kinase binding protein CGI-121 n=1 Tax=Candidatus Argoarchaeum ethanivorans TaxID=2608793 RepID=A0A811T899_9EURY|nr:MAG: Kinase binding protein CGI-121 [Candidatus Argoarchaeum ethanivorans]
MIHILCGSATIKDTEEFIHQLNEIFRKYGVVIQAVDADLVAGRKHLITAAERAIRSFREKTNVANNLGMETLLYVAGSRQIEKALQFGVKRGCNNIALLIISKSEKNTDNVKQELKKLISERPDVADYIISKKEKLMSAFNITQEEIAAAGEDKIPDLVLERVALRNIVRKLNQ